MLLWRISLYEVPVKAKNNIDFLQEIKAFTCMISNSKSSPHSKMSKKKSPFDPLRWCNICSFRADKAFKGFGCTSLGSHHTCWAFTNVHSSVLIQILIPTGALYVLMCHYWSSRQHNFWDFHSAHTRVTMVIPNYSNTIYDAISGNHRATINLIKVLRKYDNIYNIKATIYQALCKSIQIFMLQCNCMFVALYLSAKVALQQPYCTTTSAVYHIFSISVAETKATTHVGALPSP